MSNSHRSRTTFSGWKGLEERIDLCDAEHIVESINVEFKEGNLVRRRGRAKLLDSSLIRPTKVVHFDGTATVKDVTVGMTDGTEGVAVLTDPFSGVGAELFIGFPFRVGGVRIVITAASAANTTMVTQAFNRGSGVVQGAFVTLTKTDGTAAGGFTLKQTGTVTWTFTEINTTNPWTPGAVAGAAAVNKLLDQDLYWVRITTAAITTGAHLAEVQGTLTCSDLLSLRGQSSGAIEFITRTGDRYIVSQQDLASTNPDSILNRISEARTIAYDLARGDGIPLKLPQQAKFDTAPLTKTSFLSFNGWLIGATTSGFLYAWNGKDCIALEAVPGNDAIRGVIGAQSYFNQPPRGTILSAYRNRLVVAGDPLTPLSFRCSIEDNNITVIPASAQIGGPNVWPLRYVFNIPGGNGDAITAMTIIRDTLIVFTRTQSWAFDDVSLRNVNANIGCVAPASVQVIMDNVFFLSYQGVIILNGSSSTNISGPVTRTLQEVVNWNQIDKAVSAHDEANNEYWLWLPINGESRNGLAIVFNYATTSWRTVSGWFPFDTNARRDSNSVTQTVYAAARTKSANGKTVIVSLDADSILWQENTGNDDDGKIFPAFVKLPIIGNASYQLYGPWYINADSNGQWYEVLAIPDGERFDQEIDRRFAGAATNSEIIQKRALSTNAVGGATQNTFDSGANWTDTNHTNKRKKYKFSFRRNLAKMQPAIIWSQGLFNSGFYNNQIAVRGKINELQISTDGKENGR